MDPAVNDISVWAAITHQRFLLRRAALATPCDVASAERALNELCGLAKRADTGALAPVALLVRQRLGVLTARRTVDRVALFTLLDALDRAYDQALARL